MNADRTLDIFTAVLLSRLFFIQNKVEMSNLCFVQNKLRFGFMYIFTWLDEFPAAIIKADFEIEGKNTQISCSIDSFFCLYFVFFPQFVLSDFFFSLSDFTW